MSDEQQHDVLRNYFGSTPSSCQFPWPGLVYELFHNGLSLSVRISSEHGLTEVAMMREGEKLYDLRGARVQCISCTTFMGQDLLKIELARGGTVWIRQDPEIGVAHDFESLEN